MAVLITLNESELLLATMVAAMRHAQNLSRGRTEAHGAEGGSVDPHITGAIGECAVAKHLNRFWSGALGEMRAKDVGRIQVRSSKLPNPSLILHPGDPDEDRFVLVSVRGNAVVLLGWIVAKDGKQERFWRTDTGRPAFFVTELHEFRDRNEE